MIGNRENQRGFTLIEVLVAMAILSLTFLSLLSLSNSSIQQAIYNRDNTIAVTLARHRMEILSLKVKRGDIVDSAIASESELDYGFQEMIEEDYPGLTIEEEIGPVEDLPFEIPVNVELLNIKVTVKWDGGLGQEEEFTLEGYVAKYGTNN
jgi:type II secretion system protein I